MFYIKYKLDNSTEDKIQLKRSRAENYFPKHKQHTQ